MINSGFHWESEVSCIGWFSDLNIYHSRWWCRRDCRGRCGGVRHWTFSGQKLPFHPSLLTRRLENLSSRINNGRYIKWEWKNLHFGHGWLSQPQFADLGHETALCRPGIILGGSSMCAHIVHIVRAANLLHAVVRCKQCASLTDGRKNPYCSVGAIAHNYSRPSGEHHCAPARLQHQLEICCPLSWIEALFQQTDLIFE